MARRGIVPDSFMQAISDIRADYNAAKTSRFRRTRAGVSATGRSADYHYKSDADYLRMMELARDFDRNDVVVGQGVNRLVNNIFRDEIKLDPKTGDSDLDAALKLKWRDWATTRDRCDIEGERTFHQIAKLCFRARVVDGDIFVHMIEDGTVQVLEAHRCRTPKNTKRNVVHGVLLDDNRKRLQCWFTKTELNPNDLLSRVSDIAPVDVRDEDGDRKLFQIIDPRRISQTRGVTALAPVVDAIGMHDDVQFANLVRQQVVSAFAIIEEIDDTDITSSGAAPKTGSTTSDTHSDGTTRTQGGVSPGMRLRGDPGVKFRMESPNVPNPEFFPHAMLILTFIAVNLDLPVAVLLLDPSKTNFSGWRGAIDQARQTFIQQQGLMVEQLYEPVYRYKISQWMGSVEFQGDAEFQAIVAAAENTNNADLLGHDWRLPGWPYIEPVKDTTSDLIQVRNGMISQRRMQAKLGRDWDDVSTEIVDDNGMAITKAIVKAQDIQKETGEQVHWREVLSLPTPDGVSVKIDANPGDEPAPANQGADNAQ